MNGEQLADEDQAKAPESRIPNRQGLIVVVVASAMPIAQVVNQGMPGQALWLRMLVAGAIGGFLAVVVGFVWFKFWHASWCQFWHPGLPVTSDSQSAN